MRVSRFICRQAQRSSWLFSLVIMLFAALIFSCATPIGPTGGPRDQKGPVILSTQPESGTTNFDGNKIDFYFNEYVNRNSLTNNITVEPDLGLDYDIDWKKKRLTIAFDGQLPDSTTIIVTLSGNISDTKSNKMGSPVTVAVSTGDEIDQGQITGRVRYADSGEPIISEKVLLYRSPIDLKERATYQAETDTGGVFRFSYLREGAYKAIYLEDRNRNKIWDRKSESAQGFSLDTLELAKADTAELGIMYVQRVDTIAPKLQAVGMFSSQRLRLRFNDDVQLTDSVSIQIQDTLQAPFASAQPLYISPKEGFVLFAQSEKPLSPEETYSLSVSGITDDNGNQATTANINFMGSAQEDTTLQRIIGVEAPNGLFPTQGFTTVYATDIRSAQIVDSVVVVEGDVSFDDWPEIETKGNRLTVFPQERWIEGIDYQFLFWNPVTQRRAIYNPDIWDAAEMGELEIVIEEADTTAQYHYRLVQKEAEIELDSTTTGLAVIENLPPLTYQLFIFKDENGNGRWDKGAIDPFIKPEPYHVQRKISIRTGFTSQVTITF